MIRMQRERLGNNLSYSQVVKEELNKRISSSRHCQLAELSALFFFSGNDLSDESVITFRSENVIVVRKCFTLLRKTFNIDRCVDIDESIYKNGSAYVFNIEEEQTVRMIRQALLSDMILQKSCCKRAFLRGAFMAAGSVSDPDKSYHFEIACHREELSLTLINLLLSFNIEGKEIIRKKTRVVYLKEGSMIVEALNVMEAPVALMDYENSRILKDMRNSLNRRVNCETANITKTVNAAVKQTEDIKKVMTMPEYKTLSDGIKQVAELRLAYPDVSLKELGELCTPPIGKSGVNHRLRKLAEIADKVNN